MDFTKLIWNEPWLAPIVLNFRSVIATESIGTAGVTPDGKTLYYNPHFWAGLRKEEQLGVQLHEVLHIANRHAVRKDYRIHLIWNMACDMAINDQITASGYKLPAGVLPGVRDTAENIYETLQNKVTVYKKKIPLESDLLERNADGSKNCCDSSTIEAVESAAQLAGSGSSPLSRQFCPQPAKENWRTILQNYVKSSVNGEMDYLGYEFDEFGICEDILLPKPYPRICALVDESGSIEDELFAQFLGELSKMSRFALVYVSGFTDNTELNAVPLKKYRRTMTGGTDVTLPYQQACKEEFDCIIILTDGYLDFPAVEPRSTIWVMPKSFGRNREVIL